MNTNILDFGAKPDGKTLCTKGIQAAIDACAASGGGRVVVPAGNYVSGTIWLRSNVELYLEDNSVIRGSDDLDDYNAEDAYSQNFSSRSNEKWLGKHLVVAHECENVAITGGGTLDGNAEAFLGDIKPYSAYCWRDGLRTAKSDELCRPGQLVCFIECKNVRVENITLTNQPCWGCFLHGCEYVNVRGLRVKNHPTNCNSDGIDVDCCRYVTVSDCIIDTGDDAIAIRGSAFRLSDKQKPCEHITVTNCILGSSSSVFRIGVGDSVIRHVRISNICMTRGAAGVTLMTSYLGHGHVSIEDVIISNVSMANCAKPLEVLESSIERATIKDVIIENVVAEVYAFARMRCENENTVSNIVLKNWKVKLIDGPAPITERDVERHGTVWFTATNVNGLRLENFAVSDEEGYLSAWRDGAFSFDGCTAELVGVTVNGENYKVNE